jgi:stage IV sporulation protein FB
MPEEPRQELLVALAGPLVTLLIAAGLWGGMRAFNTGGSLLGFDPGHLRLLPSLFQVNVFLLAFNLIPAFPMDGGRVLRALLASRIGMVRGTRIAARTGQIFAFAFAGIGLWSSSFILLIIAGFIYLAAGAEANAVETRAAGRGMTAAEMMVTDLRTLRVYATLGDAAALLLAAEQREFPVVDNDGRLEGLLTRDDLVRGLASHGVDASVQTVMTVGIEPLTAATPFDEAVRRLRGQRLQAIPVVTDDRRVVGMVTSDNLTDLILLQRHLRPGTWSR